VAQRMMLIDDLDESEGAETIKYSFEGIDYEIDLSEKNAKAFQDALEKYITASRQAPRASLRSSGGGTSARQGTKGRSSGGGSKREDLAEIRAWARNQGKDVAERGRVAQSIIDDYDKAHRK
jgi:hypothetical protein